MHEYIDITLRVYNKRHVESENDEFSNEVLRNDSHLTLYFVKKKLKRNKNTYMKE